MLRLLSVAALLVIAVPAIAQEAAQDTLPVIAAVGAVDQAVVGTWELAEVENGGLMDELGAEIDALVLRIKADGTALVELAVIQDFETTTREDAFHCTAQNGQIQPDDRPAISYEMLGDDEIRLTDSEGVIVRMKRAESEASLTPESPLK